MRRNASKPLKRKTRQLGKTASDLKTAVGVLEERAERLRSMWDSVPDGIVYRLINDPKGRSYFEYVSAGFESLFELPEALARRDASPFYKRLHPADRAKALNAQRNAARTLTPFRYECRFHLPGGTVRWIRWHSMPERLPGGGIAWNGVALDVTARKQAEESLRQVNERLEHRIRERTAELERRSNQLARLAAELTVIEHRERRRIADCLHDDLQPLLVCARLQADTLSALPELRSNKPLSELKSALVKAIAAARCVSRDIAPPVTISRNLPDAFDWLSWDAEQRYRLHVNLRIKGAFDDVPETQSVLLFTAARELLLNVTKHAGTLKALLALKRSAGMVILEVRDEGCGFAPHLLARNELRGFGLFSIRERVELLGGSFVLKSAPSRGVSVVVRIPVADELKTPGTRDAKSKPTARAGAGRPRAVRARGRSRIRVLCADDHRSVRESLAKLLSAEPDLEVVGQCDNGRETVNSMGRLRPDVVIMDFNMPIMDGVEATRLIKKRWPATSVIGFSMYDERAAGRKMRRAGADAYVSKSDPAEEIVSAIRRCVTR